MDQHVAEYKIFQETIHNVTKQSTIVLLTSHFHFAFSELFAIEIECMETISQAY